MLCDSGATHHMLSNATFMAYLKDKFLQVSCGGASTSRSLSIGYLGITSYYLCSHTARSEPQPCVITSDTFDTLLVPDCTRALYSLTCASAQGHSSQINEEHPGILLHGGKGFVPCCLEVETGYMMLPAYPPPSTMAFVRLPDTLPVINFIDSVANGTYVSALAARAYSGAAAESSASESSSASSSSSADNDSAASSISSSSDSDSDDGSPATAAGATKGGKFVVGKSLKKSTSSRPTVHSNFFTKSKGKEPKSFTKSKSKKPAEQVTGSTRRKGTVPVNAVIHAIDSKSFLRKALIKAHERYGHVSPKKLVYFKKKGKIHSSLIPMRGGLDFKVKDCPVCAVMKNKRPKKPSAILVEEKKQWDLWEKVFSDSSGKSKVKSLQRNRYFCIFVCACFQHLRLCTLWQEALFCAQEEVSLPFSVLEICGKSWTGSQTARD